MLSNVSIVRGLTLLVLFVAGVISSHVTAASSSITTAEAFDSHEQAARAALRNAMAISESSTHEYCGGVLALDNHFYYTAPVSSASEHKCTARVRLPKGAVLAAIYHTHPKNVPIINASSLINRARQFSRLDKETAQALNVPSFLGLQWSGEILVFQPSASSRVASAVRRRIEVTYAVGGH